MHKSIHVLLLLTVVSTLSCSRAPLAEPTTAPFGPEDLYAAVARESAPPNALWLDALDLTHVYQDWGQPQPGKSVDKRPLKLRGTQFARGIGTHANSEITLQLDGAAERLQAFAGIDDESPTGGSVAFVILLDGREHLRTGVVRSGTGPVPIDVPLAGVREMILLVEDGGDSIDADHADWAGALLTLKPGARTQPRIVARPPDAPPEIAVGTPPQPAIQAPRIAGGSPGREFIFRIPATGTPPLHFSAANLPAGLTLDANEGVIRGVLGAEGSVRVNLVVENSIGSAQAALTLVVGQDALVLTPPMGWNSWNVWGTAVDEAKVRAAADSLVSSGLAAHGFQYINIDDAWEGQRSADGRIQTNEKFPDMRALADYVHSKGLRLGIYSGPGPKTCAGFVASYQHEMLDAQQWADWGIDLLKYDWCSYGELFPHPTASELRHPYALMREALDACGRDIVYSLCQYGMGDVWTWGDAVGGHYWRTTGDITDTWSSMSGIGFGHSDRAPYARPGCWNDPDMLVVGMVGWGPHLHPTRLTQHEQMTHMTLWSLLAAPLLIGCDLTQLDEFTLALLTNPEVLEVNQDPLGIAARRVKRVNADPASGTEVWSRPLADGSLAVGLFNRGIRPARVAVQWSELGISGPRRVRNLWTRQDLGASAASFETEVARHGAVMLRVSRLGQVAP